MEKTEFNYCYFVNGAVEKIDSWYKFGDDIVFFIKEQVYLFKYKDFYQELEEEELRRILGRSRPIIMSHHNFYKHRGESILPIDFYDKIRNDRDEWFVADIEKICLYMGEVV